MTDTLPASNSNPTARIMRFSSLITTLVFMFWGAICSAATPASPPNLQALAKLNASVSALVVDISHDRLLAALNPTLRLTPASTTKLYAAAAALKHWGPDHRFVTHFVTSGEVKEGTIHGDLILVSAGDPDFDTARLHTLVMRLRQAGIRRVTGNLVINAGLFGKFECTTIDRCQAQQRSKHAYDAPLSSAGVNFDSLEISIIPAAKAGQPARIALRPPGLPGYKVKGNITTVAAQDNTHYRIQRVTHAGHNTLIISGQVATDGGPYRVMRSVARPARYTAAITATLLAQAGIRVDGQRRVSFTATPGHVQSIAQVYSPTLAAQLRKMLAYSNNYMADTLTLGLLADKPPQPVTLQRAARQIEQLAHKANAVETAWDTAPPRGGPPLNIDSGSGLTVTNKLSAQDLVSLLATMYHDSANFSAFLGSQPVPLTAPSHMLKSGNQQFLRRLTAKTGYLTEPVSVFGVAGYMRLQDGGWGAYAILINGTQKDRYVALAASLDAARQAMEHILARY